MSYRFIQSGTHSDEDHRAMLKIFNQYNTEDSYTLFTNTQISVINNIQKLKKQNANSFRTTSRTHAFSASARDFLV
jgi:hypothetical protein